MIDEKLVRSWLSEQLQDYVDLELEYRERNEMPDTCREFNDAAASGCATAANVIRLLIDSFDQRLQIGCFDGKELRK